MKYIFNLIITLLLGGFAINLGVGWVATEYLLSASDIGYSLLFGLIPGFIIFLFCLPILIWVKKFKYVFIIIIDIIGFLFTIVFTAALLDTLASV